MNGVNLKRVVAEQGAELTTMLLTEALQAKEVRPEQFSVKQLFEAYLGENYMQSLRPDTDQFMSLQEAGGAVDSTALSNITGQLLITKVLEGFNSKPFIADRISTTIPTMLNGEKIPGMGMPPTDGDEVGEGMPYPYHGFGEDYIETPATIKYGLIIGITREAVFYDRTGLVLRRATEVGKRLAVKKEKRVIDVLIGATNNFKWKGTSYNTYQASAPWVNLKSSFTIVDWNSISTLMDIFDDLTDPDTGDPIAITPSQIIVHGSKYLNVKRIIRATTVEKRTNTSADIMGGDNPLADVDLEPLRSPFFNARVSAASGDSDWGFIGDFKEAIWYMENWPVTVSRAPANSEAEFERDIVMRFKGSERGVAAMVQPRASVKFNNA